MPLALAPGISFIEYDGTRIFLDLDRDRYFSLGTAADEAFVALTHGKPDIEQQKRLLRLSDAGIFVDHPFAECPRPCRQAPLHGSALDDDLMPDIGAWRILLAGWAIVRAKRRFRTRSLALNVALLRDLKSSSACDLRTARALELATIAATYAAASRLISTLDQCLALSFAVARHCLKARLDATFSMGVKLRPFEAHAWVTVDNILVSDRLDNVRPFIPILVI